jgi:Ca-activated chloride channel family protein
MIPRPLAFLIGFLLVLQPMRSDGFIVVHSPPPSRDRTAPPPFAFAPLEVTFHKVDVRIRDQVAVTSVDQEFYNPNERDLEGTYLFPVPKGAQIDKFTMEIGGKPMEAELLPAEKARKIYEDIVRKHQDPALLEYAGRDTYKVRIYPIEARSRKRVAIQYTQVLSVVAGLAQYTYPLNTERFSAQPLRTVSVKVEIETKRPIHTVYSPSHTVDIRRPEARRAVIGYQASNIRPDVDWQLYFSQEGRDVGANVLTYQPPGEDGFFLLLAAPGFAETSAKVAPKDVVFVLDTSGSMAGAKLEQARKALQFCVESLNETDRFEIIRFSTDAELLFQKLTEVTSSSLDRARRFIRELKSTGGTAINDALARALALKPEGLGRPFVIIFLTDGLPTVGETRTETIVANVRQKAGENTRVFCFGLGNDVNTHLLDGITEATRAFSQYVVPEEDIEVKVSGFFDRIKSPVLASPRLSVGDAIRISRLHPGALPDLFRGEQAVVVGRFQGHGRTRLSIEGRVENGERRFDYDVDFGSGGAENEFIARLWATRRVGYLLDEIRLRGENPELRSEVTELARQYGIVTPYTAYLILEDETRRRVPEKVQTMPQLREDKAATKAIGGAYQTMQKSTSGGLAVASARYGLALQQAPNAADALASGNVEAHRGLSSLAVPGPSGVSSTPLGAKSEPVSQGVQVSRRIAAKTFFQNGTRWIDGEVQRQQGLQPKRIEFGSEKYFAFASEHPEFRDWLALGRSVQFIHGGQLYEIHEGAAK